MSKNRKLIELIAIGDAFGRPFEFNSEEYIRSRANIHRYHNREGEELSDIGRYTDDTQMTIAIAEYMLSDEFDIDCVQPDILARHFFEAYDRDIRGGYSSRMKKLYRQNSVSIQRRSDKKTLSYDGFYFDINRFTDKRRHSNGCVMRTLPISLLPHPEWVMTAAMQQCIITHPTVECIMATQMLALYGHYLYHTQLSTLSIHGILVEKIAGYHEIMNSWEHTSQIVECDAYQTVAFVIKNYEDNYICQKDMLTNAILVGGDVDSTAALCMGLLGLRSNVHDANSLRTLVMKLENDTYGKDYIKDLDARLFKKFRPVRRKVIGN